MAHQAETILASIVTTLKTAATAAGNSVFRGRTLPVEAEENAGTVINVYEGDEASSLLNMNGGKRRALDVFVELQLRLLPSSQTDPTPIDTAMNEFARAVEVALEADFTLGATCQKFEHVATLRDRENADEEYRALTLHLVVTYRTLRTNPAVVFP